MKKQKPLKIGGGRIPKWGALWIALTDKGISAVQLGGRKREFVKRLQPKLLSIPRGEISIEKALLEIGRYLSGKTKSLKLPTDLQTGTPFQRKVWNVLRKIPFGQTRSYAWVALKVGKRNGGRAVGQACGANPIPLVIPCHRVISSSGAFGGFSAPLSWKRGLLSLEMGQKNGHQPVLDSRG